MIKLTPKGKSRYQQILVEAWRLFAEKGYAMSSMDDIAAACKCHVGNIYNYFPTKEHILYEGIRQATVGAVAINDKIESTPGLCPAEKLRQLIVEHLESRVSTSYRDLFYEYKCNLQAEHVRELVDLRDKYEQKIRRIILEGIEQGDFRDIDEKMVTILISAFIERFQLWYSPHGQMTPAKIADIVLDILMKGMQPV
jgi:TetR/AcrR family transcriptional regulator, cholesterol catabolism regulator